MKIILEIKNTPIITLDILIQYSIQNIFTKYSIIFPLTYTNNTQLIFSPKIQENEKLFFGGSSTLKGFLEDEFSTSKFSIFSTYFKYNLDSKTAAVLFTQQAIYREKNETNHANSFGIGGEISNKIGIVYLTYTY